MNRKVFTTGQISKFCGVAPRTVSKWFDSGALKGYRIPNSQDRRIPRPCLIQFLKANGFPLGNLEDQVFRILVLAHSRERANLVRAALPNHALLDVHIADFEFGSAMSIAELEPDCVLVDFYSDGPSALEVCRILQSHTKYRAIPLVALIPHNGLSVPKQLVKHRFREQLGGDRLMSYLESLTCFS